MRKVVTISVAALLLVTGTALANTVASSTMRFYAVNPASWSQVDLGGGNYIFTGVIPMAVDAAFDIYAREGASAWFGNDPGSGPVWTEQPIGADHDAWPTWNPDTPDWYQYSLELTWDGSVYAWALRNHPGATAAAPWYIGGNTPAGVPMSGIIDSTTYIGDGGGDITSLVVGTAKETGTGAYLPGTGTPEIPGGAAANGGGAGAWDMDWSWGSEVVPLEFYGNFSIEIYNGPGSPTGWHVIMTPVPVPAPGAILLGSIGVGLVGWLRRRREL